jgi:hypothetical protein
VVKASERFLPVFLKKAGPSGFAFFMTYPLRITYFSLALLKDGIGKALKHSKGTL